MAASKYRRFKASQAIIRGLCEKPHQVLFIHYSCESFDNRQDGTSPRITSIAVKYLGSEQSQCFSLHQEAELQGLNFESIGQHYDVLEKTMLDKFSLFVEQQAEYSWVHWNMRDVNYGFQGLAHRHRVLKGVPFELRNDAKVDLASILYNFLGKEYVKHPRLKNLLEMNEMVPRAFLEGKQEANASGVDKYFRIQQSTLCKADALFNLLQRAEDDDLKCANSYFDRRGFSVNTIVHWVKDHPIYGILSILAVIISLGTLIANVV